MTRTFFAILVIAAVLVAAPIQNVLSFQGKLVEGGVPVDGTRNITFKIYNVATGGVFLWQESHVAVPVVGGLFNVELGSVTTFPSAVNFSEQYWVGVSVGGGAEISPRYKLTSAAYSMSPWTINGNNIYRQTGNIGIGTDSPISRLHLTTSSGAGIYSYTGYPSAGEFAVYGEQSFGPKGGLAGYESGYDVGVYGYQGDGMYAGFFDGAVLIDGQIKITGGSPGAGKVLTSSGTGLASWQTPGGSNWTLSGGNVYRTTGRVGIGTSSPGAGLHIIGTGYPSGFLFVESTAGNDAGIRLYEGGDVKWHIFNSVSNNGLELRREGFATTMFLDQATGKVNIGTTTLSPCKLYVDAGEYCGIEVIAASQEAFYSKTVGAGGTGDSRGVVGVADPEGPATRAYGVTGSAQGATTNYGVMGSATGTGTKYGVYCSGNGGYTGSWSNLSDIKFKKNIRPMEGILDKIMKLQPKTFEMRTDEFSFMGLNEGTQYGLIAQELVEVFPELVSQGHHPGETDRETRETIHEGVDYTQVDYIPLTSILVRAIQEQQQMIDSQQTQIEELKTEIEKLKENK